MVRAAQKGEGASSPEVAQVAASIKKKDAKDFASTKHKGLPMKKEEFDLEEGMSLKDFKANRRKLKRKEASTDAKKRGHVGKEWYNSGRTYSPDEAKRGRANMDDEERSTRHRSAVDPDAEDSDYSADKTKNPKKLRKQKAMGESMINEEDYDRMKDRRMERGGVGGNNRYDRPPAKKLSNAELGIKPGKTQLQKDSEKKHGKGASALDIVKAQIRAKHGDKAIMDTKKKANEGYAPGDVDQKVGAVTAIPKSERDAAKERLLKKAAAKRAALKKEEVIHERGDFWHPDPEKDKKLGGPGANQRAREDRADAAKPKEDPKKLRKGESYMDYAKRQKAGKSSYMSSGSTAHERLNKLGANVKKKEGLGDKIKRKLGSAIDRAAGLKKEEMEVSEARIANSDKGLTAVASVDRQAKAGNVNRRGRPVTGGASMGGMNIRAAGGLGKSKPENVEKITSKYKKVASDDRKAAAKERAAMRAKGYKYEHTMSFASFLAEGNRTGRMMQKSKTQVTGHISADRGDDEKANREKRKGLEKDLKKHGIGHKKGVGEYKYGSGETGREVSYQTSKPDKMSKRRFGKVMRRLGRKHGQESVITKDKDKSAKLHYTEKGSKAKSDSIGKSKAGKHPEGYGETSGTKVRGGKLPKKTTKGAFHYG